VLLHACSSGHVQINSAIRAVALQQGLPLIDCEMHVAGFTPKQVCRSCVRRSGLPTFSADVHVYKTWEPMRCA
jgi:hypothetical protein